MSTLHSRHRAAADRQGSSGKFVWAYATLRVHSWSRLLAGLLVAPMAETVQQSSEEDQVPLYASAVLQPVGARAAHQNQVDVPETSSLLHGICTGRDKQLQNRHDFCQCDHHPPGHLHLTSLYASPASGGGASHFTLQRVPRYKPPWAVPIRLTHSTHTHIYMHALYACAGMLAAAYGGLRVSCRSCCPGWLTRLQTGRQRQQLVHPPPHH